MYQVNDLIVYGGYGVCKVTATDIREVAGTKMDCDYYAIRPMGENSVIFAPSVGGKIPMRNVMSRAEAKALLDEIPEIEPLPATSYKEREKLYKEIIKGVDNRALISLLKTLAIAKTQNRNRKPNFADSQYFRRAERMLYGELSVALNIPKETISQRFHEKYGDAKD